MSVMSDAMSRWLGKSNISVMHQESEESILPTVPRDVSRSIVCDQIPVDVKDKMVEIARESADNNKEMGAAILPGLQLGMVTTGTEKRVPIIRPEGTIGTYHTHPREWAALSSYDLLEAIVKNDKVACVGASDKWGDKIACYTPHEPNWSNLRKEATSLLQDIHQYVLKANPWIETGPFRRRRRGTGEYYTDTRRRKIRAIPLRRIFKYVGSPAYPEYVANLKGTDKPELLNRFDDSLDREDVARERLNLAMQAYANALRLRINAKDTYGLAIHKIGYPPPDVRDAAINLTNATDEVERLEGVLEIERKLLDDAQTQTEIDRINAQAEPGDLEEGRRNSALANQLAAEAEALETRRQNLIENLQDQIRWSEYKPAWKPITPEQRLIDRCRLIWEGGLIGGEDLPSELGEVLPETERERLYVAPPRQPQEEIPIELQTFEPTFNIRTSQAALQPIKTEHGVRVLTPENRVIGTFKTITAAANALGLIADPGQHLKALKESGFKVEVF